MGHPVRGLRERGVATKRQTHEEVMEGLRQQLVACMRYGKTLYVRLADSACDFAGTFSSDASSSFDAHACDGVRDAAFV